MNILLFKKLNNQAEQHTAVRQADASKDYCVGALNLFSAQEQKFQDKEQLNQAIISFAGAIRKNRKDPWPYLGMAYVLLLMGDQERALNYTQAAEKLDPNHPGVHLLLKGMASLKQSTASVKNQLAALDAAGTGAQIDYDLLYDEVELLIIQQVKKMMENPIPSDPTFDREQVFVLENHCQTLSVLCQGIEKQLRILDEEIETEELRQHMRPLNLMHQRYSRAVTLSQKLLAIDTEIETCLLKTHDQAIRLGIPNNDIANATLDDLYAHCDEIADALDELSEKEKVNIGPVEARYQQLISQIAKLADALES